MPSTFSQAFVWRQEVFRRPGMNISLRTTLIDFKTGENGELNQSPSLIERSSDLHYPSP